jgi:hypothetical protein
MAAIRPWQVLVLLTILMLLGSLIGAVLWSTTRNDTAPGGEPPQRRRRGR